MNGGTPNKAPAGYWNVRTFDVQGREARIVEVDEEQAQVIRWAFTTYATGGAESASPCSRDDPARLHPSDQDGETATGTDGECVAEALLRNPYYCGVEY